MALNGRAVDGPPIGADICFEDSGIVSEDTSS